MVNMISITFDTYVISLTHPKESPTRIRCMLIIYIQNSGRKQRALPLLTYYLLLWQKKTDSKFSNQLQKRSSDKQWHKLTV